MWFQLAPTEAKNLTLINKSLQQSFLLTVTILLSFVSPISSAFSNITPISSTLWNQNSHSFLARHLDSSSFLITLENSHFSHDKELLIINIINKVYKPVTLYTYSNLGKFQNFSSAPICNKYSQLLRNQNIILFSTKEWLRDTIRNISSSNPLFKIAKLLAVNLNLNSSKSPTDPTIYSDIRYVTEINFLQKTAFFLCRSCTPTFYKATWERRFRQNRHFTDFKKHLLLAWNSEQTISIPNTFPTVQKLFQDRSLRRFMSPQLLALFHLAENLNATFISCPGQPLFTSINSPNKKECDSSVTDKTTSFFFGTNDYLYPDTVQGSSTLLRHHVSQRFYTDDQFEIGFLTYNFLQPTQHALALLVNPIGIKCVLITVLLILILSIFCHFVYPPNHNSLPLSHFPLIFLQTLFAQQDHAVYKRYKFDRNFILTSWILYSFILTETYRGNVYKFLFSPTFVVPPANFARLVESPEYSSVTASDDFKSILFSKSEYSSLFNRTHNKFSYGSLQPVSLGLGEGLISLLKNMTTTPTAFIAAKEYIQICQEFFNLAGKGLNEFTMSSDVIRGKKVWILYDQPGVEESREVFNRLLVSGLLTRAKDQLSGSWAKAFLKIIVNASETLQKFVAGKNHQNGNSHEKIQVLRMEHVHGFFILLGIGAGISFVVFVLEKVTSTRIRPGRVVPFRRPISRSKIPLIVIDFIN